MSKLNVRAAKASDSKVLFEWRNDPKVFKYFKNPAPIEWNQHQEWFSKILSDPTSQIVIARSENEDVGMVRFDISESKAIVNIHLGSAHMGKGLGSKMLLESENWILNKATDFKVFEAHVLDENIGSVKMFEKCNYKYSENIDGLIILKKARNE